MAEASLASLMLLVVDNRGRTCPTSDTGFPLIATNCVKNDSLYPTFEKVRYVDDDTYRGWFRGHPIPGDLIFVLKGSPGEVCLTPDPVPFCVAQDMVALRPDPEKVYPPYLFAALRSDRAKNDILNMHVGTMIPHFKKGDFDRLFIPIPDGDDQRSIGDAYLTISKKIELNRRMNETLEEMARSLFWDWFVDFGPTRRQMEGATDPAAIMGNAFPPKKSATLAPLFPAKLGEDGLPEGWQLRVLHDLADWVNGAAYKNMHFSTEPNALPVIKIAELKAGITKTTKHTNTALGKKYRISNGEVLFSWSGNPDTSIDTFIWSGGDAWLNQHIFTVRPNGEVDQSVLYFLLRYLRPQFAEIARDKQTTGLGHVTKQDLKGMRVCLGSTDVETVATGIFQPFFSKLYSNQQENQTLAKMRDFLLPKLMSGEIRLKDAENLA